MSTTSLAHLPPEILEKIFRHVSSDLATCRHVSEVCSVFHSVMVRVPVLVTIPVMEDDLLWLQNNRVPVRYLYNCEIAAYVSDQIFSLNLGQLKVAKLVGYDYQSRKCEVTPHYLQTVDFVRRKAGHCLKRFELNVDLSRGRRSFRFAEMLTQFSSLRSLSIHFSAHIELNQRILNNDDPQNMIDVLLSNLPTLRTFNIFICPPRKLHVKSHNLRQFGIFKSDAIELTRLELPSVTCLNIHENVGELFRKIQADRETSGSRHLHRDLLAVIHAGCPALRTLNHVRLPADLCSPRPDQRTWTRLVNKLLVKHYKHCVEAENFPKH